MLLNVGDQPVDWARPCTIISGSRNTSAGSKPMKTVATADIARPPRMTTRGPKRSETCPQTNCPAA